MQCFVCKESVQADDHAVHNATLWHTNGNYGSEIYDQLIGDTFLEIAICDRCLEAGKKYVDEVVTTHNIEEVTRRKFESR